MIQGDRLLMDHWCPVSVPLSSHCDIHVHEEGEGARSKQGQTNNKAKQHGTPFAVFTNQNDVERDAL